MPYNGSGWACRLAPGRVGFIGHESLCPVGTRTRKPSPVEPRHAWLRLTVSGYNNVPRRIIAAMLK